MIDFCVSLTRISSAEPFKIPPQPSANGLAKLNDGTTLFCLSLFTLFEIRRRAHLWRPFLRWLLTTPSVLRDSTRGMLAREVRTYGRSEKINPIIYAPFATDPELGDERISILEKQCQEPPLKGTLDELASGTQEILDAQLALVKNFEPASGKRFDYSDARRFASQLLTEQLSSEHPAWLRSQLDSGHMPDMDHFKSVKAVAYSAFFRYYWDEQRKPRTSDPFDLAISTLLPYVDLAGIEAGQAHIVQQQISQVDDFLDRVRLVTLANLANKYS